MTTNITDDMRKQFAAITSGHFKNFALVSCFLDGKPTAAIASMNEKPDGRIVVQPLFVAVVEGMILTSHDGVDTARPSEIGKSETAGRADMDEMLQSERVFLAKPTARRLDVNLEN